MAWDSFSNAWMNWRPVLWWPPRSSPAAIESSLGEVLSLNPLFAEVAAETSGGHCEWPPPVGGRGPLGSGIAWLDSAARGWPRVAGELELAHRSGPAFRPVRNVLDRSSFELEADEVLLIAPANARAVSSGPGRRRRWRLRRPAFAGGGR